MWVSRVLGDNHYKRMSRVTSSLLYVHVCRAEVKICSFPSVLLTSPNKWKILSSGTKPPKQTNRQTAVNCFTYSIRPVHFMVGDNRLSCAPWPPVHHWYHANFILNHHISIYEPIKIHFESAIRKKKKHQTNWIIFSKQMIGAIPTALFQQYSCA